MEKAMQYFTILPAVIALTESNKGLFFETQDAARRRSAQSKWKENEMSP